MKVVAQKGSACALPSSVGIAHGNGVGDEHMIMDLRVPGPGGRLATCGPGESAGCHSGLCPASAASAVCDNAVEIIKGGVALGVCDLVHVLDTTDHAKFCDRLRRCDHELEPRTGRRR
jgi:hypothetical protein